MLNVSRTTTTWLVALAIAALGAALRAQLDEAEGDTEKQMDVLRHFKHVQTLHLLAQDLAEQGADVRDGWVTVRAQRLYSLVVLPTDAQQTLTIDIPPGVSAYDFTFG